MARVTVYLPDQLYEQVKASGIPISPTCQQALEREVSIQTMLTEGMERISLDMYDRYREREWAVAFTGRWLVEPDSDGTRTGEERSPDGGSYDSGAYYGVAFTKKGKFLIYVQHCIERFAPVWNVYDSLAEMRDAGWPQDIVAMAAAEVGADRAIELDI